MTFSSRGPYRVDVTLTLALDGPWHTGAGERLAISGDAPLLRNASLEPWMRGSSVRGALRDWCAREAPLLGLDASVMIRLFGQADDGSDRQGRLTTLDLEFQAPTTDVRDHVRLKPEWGAADEGGKFDREVALGRSAIMRLVYEGDRPDDPELRLLAAAVEAVQHGVIPFGGHSAGGLGLCHARTPPAVAVSNRQTPDGISRSLLLRLPLLPEPTASQEAQAKLPPPTYTGVARLHDPRPWSWLTLNLAWQCDGPMLTAGLPPMDDASGADATYLRNPANEPVLPGSSLRGALLAHMRKMAASLGMAGAFTALQGELGRKTLLFVGESRAAADTPPLVMNHVAIDRVTGFAVDQKLFSTEALQSPRFEHRLVVRWHHDVKPHCAGVALLVFALRDAQRGLLWVGSRTSRGYGHVSGVAIQSGAISIVSAAGRATTKLPQDCTLGDIQKSVPEIFTAWETSFPPPTQKAAHQ